MFANSASGLIDPFIRATTAVIPSGSPEQADLVSVFRERRVSDDNQPTGARSEGKGCCR